MIQQFFQGWIYDLFKKGQEHVTRVDRFPAVILIALGAQLLPHVSTRFLQEKWRKNFQTWRTQSVTQRDPSGDPGLAGSATASTERTSKKWRKNWRTSFRPKWPWTERPKSKVSQSATSTQGAIDGQESTWIHVSKLSFSRNPLAATFWMFSGRLMHHFWTRETMGNTADATEESWASHRDRLGSSSPLCIFGKQIQQGPVPSAGFAHVRTGSDKTW